jgi:hypothetical protein
MNEPDALSEARDEHAPEEPHKHPSPLVLVLAMFVGLLFMGFGVRSALGDARDAHPTALAVHIVGFDLFHDVVFAPVILLFGWVIKRVLPPYAHGPIRAAAAISLLFTVFSYPLIRRWGKRAGNSSTLPLPYGTNLLIILLTVWVATAIVVARRSRSKRVAV